MPRPSTVPAFRVAAFVIARAFVWVLFSGIGSTAAAAARHFEVAKVFETNQARQTLLRRNIHRVSERLVQGGCVYTCGDGDERLVGLVASPPCTDLTPAGLQRGADYIAGDSKHWRAILGLAQRRATHPWLPPLQFILLENVPQISKSLKSGGKARGVKKRKRGSGAAPEPHREPCLLARLIREFSALGYRACWRDFCSVPHTPGLHRTRKYVCFCLGDLDPTIMLSEALTPAEEKEAAAKYEERNKDLYIVNIGRRTSLSRWLRGITTGSVLYGCLRAQPGKRAGVLAKLTPPFLANAFGLPSDWFPHHCSQQFCLKHLALCSSTGLDEYVCGLMHEMLARRERRQTSPPGWSRRDQRRGFHVDSIDYPANGYTTITSELGPDGVAVAYEVLAYGLPELSTWTHPPPAEFSLKDSFLRFCPPLPENTNEERETMARIRAVMSERERNLRTLGESEADLPGLWLYRVSDPDDVIGRRLVLNDNRKQHWIVTDCDQTKGVLVLERYSRTNGSVTEVLRLEQYWNTRMRDCKPRKSPFLPNPTSHNDNRRQHPGSSL